MPRSKEGKKRTRIDDTALRDAIKFVNEKKFTLFGAAKHFQIPRTTLRRYYQHCMEEGTSIKDLRENLAVKRVFTKEEDKMLVDYIKEAAQLQFGLTLKEVKILAYQFAKANKIKYPASWDADKMAGDFWLRLFRKRFKNEISLRKPEATSLARSSAFNSHTVGLTYDNYKKALSQCPDFQAVDIWNIDETGLSTVHVPPKVLAPTGLKQVGSMTSAERGSTVTMIAACNAGGGFIPPMLIFPRVNFKEFMIYGAPEGTVGAANPSGWSNETTFLMFMEHFIRFTRPSKERPIIVLMDNHESHISVPVIRLAKENGVILVTLHPHTSNKMQPLDKSVFGPFKTFFNQAANEKLMTPGQVGKPLTIYDIAGIVGKAFPLAFTPMNISNGFKATGFHPLNENIFSDADFMPSECTNRPPPQETSAQADHTLSVENSAQDDSLSTNLITDHPQQGSETSVPSHCVLQEEPSKQAEIESTDIAPIAGLSSVTVITPKMIRPHPKAAPRKASQKGRQKGKSRILTDTPEKTEIEHLKSSKKIKLKKSVKLVKHKVKRRVLAESESDESNEDDEIYSVHDTDDSCGEVEKVDYEVGDFVIFIYEGEYFVGQIESLCEEAALIKSMQKSLKNWKWPDNSDLNLYPHQDIIQKINEPKRVNSKREVYYVPEMAKYWDFC